MPPGPRAGFSMCVHKRRALLFGGVVDMEVEGKYLHITKYEWNELLQTLFANYRIIVDTNPFLCVWGEGLKNLKTCGKDTLAFEMSVL